MLKKIILNLKKHKVLDRLPDKVYLELMYYARMGKKLHLKKPKTFNEKLQWLKINDRKDIYSIMVDKYESKEYVSSIIGKKYIIPTIAVYDGVEDIDFDKLPKEFVMKCTHDSGGIIVCKNKKELNKEFAKVSLDYHLGISHFDSGREWPYKNVKPRIIVEKFIGENLTDYRFYCFDGKVKFIYEYLNKCRDDGGKPEPIYCNVYNRNWKERNFRCTYKPSPRKTKKPKNLNKMIEIAEKLSQKNKFLRVDLYNLNGKIYFGELTFYPGNGFARFYPEEADYKLGSMLNLE